MEKFFFMIAFLSFLAGCGSKSTLTDEQVEKYTEQGEKIAQASFERLSSQLKQAIKNGGIEQAIGFCNVVALPLTDSLSVEHNAVIKRTSLKLRNPQNAPDSLEQKMLKMYLIMSRMRKPIMVPKILVKNEQEIQFYAPIMAKNETCLNCHGVIGETMKVENYAIIKKHYPADKAIGYRLGEFRGMWSITLKK